MSPSRLSPWETIMSNAGRKNPSSPSGPGSSPPSKKCKPSDDPPLKTRKISDVFPSSSPAKHSFSSDCGPPFVMLMSGGRKNPSSSSGPGPSPPKKPKTSDTRQKILKIGSRSSGEEIVVEELKEEKMGLLKKNSRSEDIVVELKEKIGLLKEKKPRDFRSERVVWWEKEEKTPFLFLCLTFDLISKETKSNAITDIMCNMLRCVMDTTPGDLLAIVYLVACELAPAQEGLELGIGEFVIIKTISDFGSSVETVKKQCHDKGELGLVAQEILSSQPMIANPKALTVDKVFKTFKLIAKESGKGSQDKKKSHITKLLVAATDCEPLYLVRLLQSKLRIGVSEKTLLAALGQAAAYREKHSAANAESHLALDDAAEIVKQVYSVLPDYGRIVEALLSDGLSNLPTKCQFTLGVPVGPMLAKSTKSVLEIVSKFQNMEYICEYKYDGERAQIHCKEDGSVEIYSRNAERTTVKYHDVVDTISRVKDPSTKSFVLDCEIVAYDREKGKILPFQVLSTRARKNVDKNVIKVPVCIYAFDLLYINGDPIIQKQLKDRRERLGEAFKVDPGFFQFAESNDSSDVEEIQNFLDQAVDASCEGLVIKTLSRDATYEPSMRSNNWLKLKKDYMDNIGDSLDLVPIGAFDGKGKRAGVYGAFLLACYDSAKDEYQSICKIGTGFSDAVLEERFSSLRSKVIPTPKPYYRFGGTTCPDVWFEPSEVWEVKGADLTISPVYHAAIGEVDDGKGISLRFPRLVRVRVDKSPEQATSSEQVAEMYKAQ